MKAIIILIAFYCASSTFANNNPPDPIYTVVNVAGYSRVTEDAHTSGDMCTQVKKSLLRRFTASLMNTTECHEGNANMEGENALLTATLIFLGPTLEEYLLYNNERDFKLFLEDVFRYKPNLSDTVNITSVEVKTISTDGLHLRFVNDVHKDGQKVDFDSSFTDPNGENFLKYKQLVSEDFKVIKARLNAHMVDAYLGYSPLYFYENDGKTRVVTDMYFDYEKLVQQYGKSYGTQVFIDMVMTFIASVSQIPTIKIDKSTTMERGDITVITLTGDLYDGEVTATWSRDLRISDSDQYKKFTKEAISHLSDIFKNGGPDLFSALYGFRVRRYSKEEGTNVKLAVQMLLHQIDLHCKQFPSKKDALQKNIESMLTEGQQLVGAKIVRDIKVKVTHIASVPPEVKCPVE